MIGKVMRFDAAGKAVATFKGGVRKHLSSSDIRKLPQFSMGDEVTWPKAPSEIKGGAKAIGKIQRFDAKNFTVVSFRGATQRYHIHPGDLRRVTKFAVNDEVVWEEHPGDKEVKAGAQGTIVRYDARGHAVVKFRGGVKRHIPPSELRRPSKIQAGDDVTWPAADKEIPKGSVGQVLRFDAQHSAVVKFRGGKKRHIPTGELLKAAKLFVGESVVWSGEDSETPRGSVGKVMRFDAKDMALVRFGGGKRRRLPVGELRRPGDTDEGAARTFKILSERGANRQR